MTKDRLEEIKAWHKQFDEQDKSHPFIGELISEVEALNEENLRIKKESKIIEESIESIYPELLTVLRKLKMLDLIRQDFS